MIIDLIAAVAGILVVWVSNANFIPHPTSDVLASIFGLMGTLALAIKPFFGVKITGNTVPADQVTAMEDKK